MNIIKVGGAVVENEVSLAALLDRFASLEGNRVLVHGGGRSATAMAAQLGIETTMVNGRRVTDEQMLRVVTMVYGGLVNKRIVAQLQARGVNALGLTGADMNVIHAHRRPVKSVVNAETGERQDVDYGFVGDIDGADGKRLATFLQSGVTPVMAPLSHDGEGNMLNVNADTIAATTAVALAEHFNSLATDTEREEITLTYCFEKPGVLADPDDDTSVIASITPATFEQYVKDGVISGGMIPKIENAIDALRHGVSRVVITSVDNLTGGTVIKI